MRTLTIMLAGLALAGCGEAAAPPGDPGGPVETPVPVVRQLDAVPAAFHGVWAATVADCTPPAETRLEISATRVNFYESSGDVAQVEATGDNEILIVVPLSGEGAQSRRSFRYRLLADGARLFDVRNGLDRIRCPSI
jgi:hypothetical protein